MGAHPGSSIERGPTVAQDGNFRFRSVPELEF